MSYQFGNFVVIDPRLAAPRGEEYTASAENDRRYAQNVGEDVGPLEEHEPEVPAASVETAISSDNVGFKLLQKMGWKAGAGLGKNETGIVEPIKPTTDPGVKLGVGKQEQDNFYTAAENVQRKRLEVEIQAQESEDRAKKREIQAEREQRIKEDVSTMKRNFYCEVCHKQYNTAMEMETHLSSYDHHHKKRLQEMKAMTAERNKQDRQKRQHKQAAKEMARLEAQMKAARDRQQQAMGNTAPARPQPPSTNPPPAPQCPAPPPPPPSSPPPPPPPEVAPPHFPHPSTSSECGGIAAPPSAPTGMSFKFGTVGRGTAAGRGAVRPAPGRVLGIKRPAADSCHG